MATKKDQKAHKSGVKLAGDLSTFSKLRQFQTRVINMQLRKEISAREMASLNSGVKNVFQIVQKEGLEADVEKIMDLIEKHQKRKGRNY